MKKRNVLTLAASLLAVVAICGCDGGSEGVSGGGGTRSRKDALKTLTYLTSADSQAYNTILNKVISDFNERIEPRGYKIITETPGNDYYQSLGSKFAARTAPDIFQMEEGVFNSFQGNLLNLDPYIDNSEILHRSDLWDINDFYKNNQGQLTCLIKDFSPDFMLIYNKTMLDNYNKAHPEKQFIVSETEPMSWLEYYEMCSTIQRTMGVKYGSSLGFEGVKHLHELVQSTGSEMYTQDDKNVRITDPNVRAAFEFFCALQKQNAKEFTDYYALNAFQDTTDDTKGMAPGNYTSGSTTSEQQLFIQSKCFSIFNGLYAFAGYDFYGINDFEYGIAPHPVQDPKNGAFGTTSAMVSHAIYKGTKYPDIAWEFLEYYQTTGIEQFAKIAYNIPGNKTIAGSDNFLKNDNPKVEKLSNYFYNFVNNGNCTWTKYNNQISYSIVQTCFNSQLAKYYDGLITFDDMLTGIDQAISSRVK